MIQDLVFDASIIERAFYWPRNSFFEGSILIEQVGGTLDTPVFTWEGSFDLTIWKTVVAVTLGTRVDWTEIDYPNNRLRVSTAGGSGLLISINVDRRRQKFGGV